MRSSGSALPLRRKLVYSLVITLLALVVLEGGARVVERVWLPYTRELPLPAPGAPGALSFRNTVREAQRKAGMPERAPLARPEVELRGLPLREDPRRGWTLPPNTILQNGEIGFRFNAQGLRGPELVPPEAGEVRLFTLGDSSIFGDGVAEKEIFSSITAEALSAAWKRKVTTVIGAVPGHDSSQSLTTLRDLGSLAQPSWLVIGNFWSDVYRKDNVRPLHEEMIYVPPLRERLRGYALYRLFWRMLNPLLQSQRVKWMVSREDLGSTSGGRPSRVPLEDYVHNLKEMVALAKTLGARPAFVMLPAPLDFDRVPPPPTIQEYRLAMRQVAEQAGAPLVDGPALFKEKGAHIGYFFDQVHPTQEGHALLGEALARALEPAGPPPAGKSRYF